MTTDIWRKIQFLFLYHMGKQIVFTINFSKWPFLELRYSKNVNVSFINT